MASRSNFSSSMSYSVSSTNQNGETTTSGQQTSHQRTTDENGHTTVRSTNQNLGEPAVESTKQFDSAGRELNGVENGATGSRRVQDISDEQQAQNDRDYEERMEEEYAKREGGA
ncbi:uncharacterized protein RCC_01515 [Ramularia collo-cygni]|uniref:Uncharacterized protein n=1 Tax=Ramularia collo-cygni TaxID=112498 RepID=A0A2D3ULX4_9PEZI|nr:uncharacterized protein RCC_01515 [Ramularia collo-cygni]CZT15682.1 uncharacterized protein RCC_01515 [Ramularia collo-cygni]